MSERKVVILSLAQKIAIAEAYKTGKYTKAELARANKVSPRTIGRVIDEIEGGESLKPADLIDSKFGVGSQVTITYAGDTYSKYEALANDMKVPNWRYGKSPAIGEVLEVISVARHPSNGRVVYAVKDSEGIGYLTGSKYMKEFVAPKSICEKSGYVIGARVLVDKTLGDYKGLQGVISRDDGDGIPLVLLDCGQEAFFYIEELTLVDESSENKDLPLEVEEPEEDYKTATEYGYVEGDQFVVTEDDVFTKGSIITLAEDDGSDCPFFILVGGSLTEAEVSVFDKDARIAVDLRDIKPYVEDALEVALEAVRQDSPSQFVMVPNSVIVITHNKEIHTVEVSHQSFEAIVNLCVGGNFDMAVSLAEPSKAITEFTKGDVTVKGETVYYRGEETRDGLADAIIRLMSEGDEGFKKLVAFMGKVKQNPSYKSRHELFGFIKAKDIEITEAGDLICWKKIRHDWTDCYTGTIDNSIGARPKVDRSEVDDDSNRTCSNGLHAAAKSYLSHFHGQRVVKVLVNPKDVVSIPTDYNDAKMRTCEYLVLEEVTDTWQND